MLSATAAPQHQPSRRLMSPLASSSRRRRLRSSTCAITSSERLPGSLHRIGHPQIGLSKSSSGRWLMSMPGAPSQWRHRRPSPISLVTSSTSRHGEIAFGLASDITRSHDSNQVDYLGPRLPRVDIALPCCDSLARASGRPVVRYVCYRGPAPWPDSGLQSPRGIGRIEYIECPPSHVRSQIEPDPKS
jgi:hypothetical protein